MDITALLVNNYVSSFPVLLSKSGSIVALSFYIMTIGDVANATMIMTLPIGYRPSANRYCSLTVTGGGSGDETPYNIRLLIATDGTVKLGHDYSHKVTHPYAMGTLLFVI